MLVITVLIGRLSAENHHKTTQSTVSLQSHRMRWDSVKIAHAQHQEGTEATNAMLNLYHCDDLEGVERAFKEMWGVSVNRFYQ